MGCVEANQEGFTSLLSSSHIRRMSGGEKPDTSHSSHEAVSAGTDMLRRLMERLLGALEPAGEETYHTGT
jgi:hypothetical protein